MVSSPQTYSPVRHSASMVDPALHASDILDLVELKRSRTLLTFLIETVIEAVDHAFAGATSSTVGPVRRNSGRQSALSTDAELKFASFAKTVVRNADVSVATLLVTLVYIMRARKHMHIALAEYACERVFLGALVVASKYSNDSTLRNVHWAACTGVFGKHDVGRVEREFLDVLAFELSVSEPDLLAATRALPARSSRARRTPVAPVVPQLVIDTGRLSPPALDSDGSSSSASSAASGSPRTPSTLVDMSPPVASPEHNSRPKAPSPTRSKRHAIEFFRAALPPYHRSERPRRVAVRD